MEQPEANQNPYTPPVTEDPDREKCGRNTFRAIVIAGVLGGIVDVFYAVDAYQVYNTSKRLIPWGSTSEEILGFTFFGSAGTLLLGFVISLSDLPGRRSFFGIAFAVVSLTIHAITVFYARHVLLSFG